MSKTAQRKQSAYHNGYRVGRYGWPSGVKCFRVGVFANSAYNKGLSDGRRDAKIEKIKSRPMHLFFMDFLRLMLSGARR